LGDGINRIYMTWLQLVSIRSLMAFLLSGLFTRVFITLAPKLGLVAHPKGHSTHQGVVPIIGGCGIFLAIQLLTALPLPLIPIPPSLPGYSLTLTWVFVLGVIDDRVTLSPRNRLIGQALTVLLVLVCSRLSLDSLGDLFNNGNLRILPWLSGVATFLVMTGIVNAYNMVDGLDGLAASLSLSAFIGIAVLAWGAGNVAIVHLSGVWVAALLGFLLFNLPALTPSRWRCFLGDSGSTTMGFTIAYLFLTLTHEPTPVSPVACLWLAIVPITDLYWSLLRRYISGRSPTEADQYHLHHLLKNKVGKDWLTVLTLASLNGIGVLVGVYTHRHNVPEWLIFWPWVALVSCILTVLFYYHQQTLRAVQVTQRTSGHG
jgi:UDP-GlcNAc:undecaprenyl-phosphate/decaprenyl-phosphate GlcNAc-1-phosphate transferase